MHKKRREGARNSHVFNEKLLFLHILIKLLLIEWVVTPITHVMAKRRSCHNKLTAKKRKLLVAEFQFEDQLIVDDVLEVFWSEQHFDEYKARDNFRHLFRQEKESLFLRNYILKLQETYKKLLQKFCVGTKFLQMQHSWLLHINFLINWLGSINSNLIRICRNSNFH